MVAQLAQERTCRIWGNAETAIVMEYCAQKKKEKENKSTLVGSVTGHTHKNRYTIVWRHHHERFRLN